MLNNVWMELLPIACFHFRNCLRRKVTYIWQILFTEHWLNVWFQQWDILAARQFHIIMFCVNQPPVAVKQDTTLHCFDFEYDFTWLTYSLPDKRGLRTRNFKFYLRLHTNKKTSPVKRDTTTRNFNFEFGT